MSKNLIAPDYLFEVSWEVCNKIGGIHTVISTKATSVIEQMKNKYIVIGPDVWRDSGEHPEFREDSGLFDDWRDHAAEEGLIVRTGHWKIGGDPVAILVDFTPFFNKKDDIFSKFWEIYHLDSLSGQWDYVEPMLFGYATGRIIESFIRFYGLKNKKVVSHFHEWMTGAGLLYLKENQTQVGTVFTTHATVLGRSMAGNNQPLYSKLESYNSDEKAREFGVVAKQSVEKIAAMQADTFTTVSEITARECAHFLGKPVDLTTPNGFDDSFVPPADTFDDKRTAARQKLLEIASLVTGDKFPEDSLLVATSGRYEFRNKGIDLLLDALGKLNGQKSPDKRIIAFILVPANHFGPRKDLLVAMKDSSAVLNGDKFLTHYLHYAENDPVLQRLKQNGLNNQPGDAVQVIFVPSYLKGADGIFNLAYYDILIGLDLTVFPSYYEPWGYTPLESLAFSIPTVTTTLAGFGKWIIDLGKQQGNGIRIIPRDDKNDAEAVEGISKAIRETGKLKKEELEQARKEAYELSRLATWEALISNYWRAYSLSLERSGEVEVDEDYYSQERIALLPSARSLLVDVHPVWRRMTVQQQIPDKLRFLEVLSRNIWWSWTKDAVDLFRSMNPELWEEVEENPIMLLERISFERLKSLERDDAFLGRLEQVRAAYTSYMGTPKRKNEPSVSYFSMEFGLHNSLKIYSGGLGLLAGDYLKEASDYNYDMVGIGLLYRYGYFRQVVTSAGTQVAHDDYQDFSRIPVTPVKDEEGNWRTIQVVLPGRPINLRIWKAQVGRVPLFLLDADFDANKQVDREVTHKLYGGDHENRFKQELLLGIGGVRALRELGIQTDLYHLNEGHAAFTGFERLREYIQEQSMTYPEAREMVRATTLFTTHTPVPAGHDSFDENMMRTYMSHYPPRLTVDWNRLMNLGRENHNNSQEKFSMSVLALNLSQEVNGVSKLHGQVSREMFEGMWKGYLPAELHIGYVTNGVHLSTWLSDRWRALYLEVFGENFLEKQEDRSLWNKIHEVKDERIWKIRNEERSELINYIRARLSDASSRFMEDPKLMIEIADAMDERALTIGFARRFATYKRANLIFSDPERLAALVNNPERPIQFVFAGKAHPNDFPGQELIRKVVEISKKPEFIGKIIFLQNYNIQLAKRLLHGVDIWLNTPTRPLEASGTSGEKAVMNGGLHFSVLDGWWAEGYKEDAGWALPLERTFENKEQQDQLDAERIYSLLENEVGPKFYARNSQDVPEDWIKVIKNSVSGVAPEFTMNRMLRDYIDRYYSKLYGRSKKLMKNDYRLTREISYFKKQIIDQWKEIRVVEMDIPDLTKGEFKVGHEFTGTIKLDLNGIPAENIGMEMVLAEENELKNQTHGTVSAIELECIHQEGSVATYEIVQQAENSGQYDVGFRIFPKMEDLPHRMDLPLVRWI
ncbi:MAG: alpha-glucan family phosphorylase [Bacteroidales bacterium]